MDLNGTQKWTKRFLVSGSQSVTDITQINNNLYLLSGGRWFFQIDSDGNLIQTKKMIYSLQNHESSIMIDYQKTRDCQ